MKNLWIRCTRSCRSTRNVVVIGIGPPLIDIEKFESKIRTLPFKFPFIRGQARGQLVWIYQ